MIKESIEKELGSHRIPLIEYKALNELIPINEWVTNDYEKYSGYLIEKGHVTSIQVNKYELTSLPDSISNLKKLERLYLNNNNLTSLPESIGQLKNLTELYLQGNELISVPESIGELDYLTIINLRNNKLTSIPVNACQLMQNVISVELEDNKFIQTNHGYLLNVTKEDQAYIYVNQIVLDVPLEELIIYDKPEEITKNEYFQYLTQFKDLITIKEFKEIPQKYIEVIIEAINNNHVSTLTQLSYSSNNDSIKKILNGVNKKNKEELGIIL